MRTLPLTLALVLSISCKTTEKDTSEDDSDDGATVVGIHYLADYMTGNPIEGAIATIGDQTVTSNGTGIVSYSTDAGASFDLRATLADYPDLCYYGLAGDTDYAVSNAWVSTSTIGILGSLLGVNTDPTDGMLAVSVGSGSAWGAWEFLAGATVDLDVAYDMVLVEDSKSAYGISPGNTTLANSGAHVIFINVAVGDAQVSITTPDGTTCKVAPGGTADRSVPIVAGSYSQVTYICN